MTQPPSDRPRRERFDIPAPRRSDASPARHRTPQNSSRIPRWQIAVVGVFVLVTLLVLVDAVTSKPEEAQGDPTAAVNGQDQGAQEGDRREGPVPDGQFGEHPAGELPPGGPYTQKGSDKYELVGQPGMKVGEGRKDHYTYVVEVEDTIDGAVFGGKDSFAAMVDATLSNPKSWIADPEVAFEHVDQSTLPEGKEPDFRFQLSSAETTHKVCGNSYKLETSCFMPIGNRVVINESRWIRGALPFAGDIGGYRQYVINHELGHGIGYAAHQACPEKGRLAPVMMQQTLSLNNRTLHDLNPDEVYGEDDTECLANPWPYPTGGPDARTQQEMGTREDPNDQPS